ncbi:LLM class flavin-dependent oxidoreductase [Agromyces mangrovi Wang et al. 2018]|uniref:LLM class flavin-dependent oxidoreductase n=1 Tax=Agromyces mangrovi TaxID=1858653 RepID=UPI0025734676|nr:LLM class flavin-dependent oxidoreductase [Agromyces mangrovi]BDZ65285.1 hypothetical protein GCM10025877_22230 [Agromyces mangrovi]
MTRFALAVPHWGPFGDPREAARIAERAESAGWDGYFTWGGFVSDDAPPKTYDPWVILAAVASATSRMRIGTCIAPLPAFQPHVVASIVASLDVLSGGRMTLGVGIGDVARSFEVFGQSGDRRTRAAQLDEALEVIVRLWSGERVVHHGEHYVVDGLTLAAVPVQRPRVPIWVGGDSAPAKRRAARWDGWIGPDEHPADATAADLREVRRELSSSTHPVELVWAGELDDVGTADWAMVPLVGSRDACEALVEAGPRRGAW